MRLDDIRLPKPDADPATRFPVVRRTPSPRCRSAWCSANPTNVYGISNEAEVIASMARIRKGHELPRAILNPSQCDDIEALQREAERDAEVRKLKARLRKAELENQRLAAENKAVIKAMQHLKEANEELERQAQKLRDAHDQVEAGRDPAPRDLQAQKPQPAHPPPYDLSIDTPLGKVTLEGMKPTTRVADVIQRLADQLGPQAQNLWLRVGSKPLDPARLLKAYDLSSDSTVRGMIRALGGCSDFGGSFRKLFADMDCKVTCCPGLREWIDNQASENCVYECGWNCVGSTLCKELFHNTNSSARSKNGYVHRWTTKPTSNGRHWHSFSMARPPSVVPPNDFPDPPRCPAHPGPPPDEFFAKVLNEGEVWKKWHHDEDNRLKIATQSAHEMMEGTRKTRQDQKKNEARRAISSLDCPAQRGFTIKIDEGPDVIARCGGGQGTHTLAVNELVYAVTNFGFDAMKFKEFVEMEKQKWIGKDVNTLVSAYVEVEMTRTPDLKRMEFQAEQDRERDHKQRLNEQTALMQNSRREMYDEVERQYLAPSISLFLDQASWYVSACERLSIEWDEYDRKRSTLESTFKRRLGFDDRGAIPIPQPARWHCHPVLKHANNDDLAQRWADIHMLASRKLNASSAPKDSTEKEGLFLLDAQKDTSLSGVSKDIPLIGA